MNVMGVAGRLLKEKYYFYKGQVGKVTENIINRNYSTTELL